jgi:carbon storage regulator
MLYLTRKLGQSIIINNTIEVKVIEVRGKNVKLGFEFPPEASVLRKEVHDSVREENIVAAQTGGGDTELMLGALKKLKGE